MDSCMGTGFGGSCELGKWKMEYKWAHAWGQVLVGSCEFGKEEVNGFMHGERFWVQPMKIYETLLPASPKPMAIGPSKP